MKSYYKLPIKTTLVVLLFSFFATALNAQTTSIPDPNFEQALINLGIDSDGTVNGQVLTSDIETVLTLDISNVGITDLTGIQDFAALENLDVSSFYGTSLSFSNNENLKELVFNHNTDLRNMDITNNVNLEIVRSSYSMLSELDLTNKPNLIEVVLGDPSPADNHGIETLDLSQSPLLAKLQLINLVVLTSVDLRSGNNVILTDVFVECSFDEGFPCEPTSCFMVDDTAAAQNNQFPYSEWEADVIFSEDCAMGLLENDGGSFSLYPNPVGESLVLISPASIGNTNLQIYDIQGKLLSAQNATFEKQVSIDVSNLSSGIYFLNIKTENGNVEVKKFIKE